MSKHRSRSPHTPGGSRGKQPRWLLYAWFHLEIVPGLRCWRCHERPVTVRFDDYFPQPSRQQLLSVPLEEAADQLFAALLAEQAALGPRVHQSLPYCLTCTRGHIDAIFPGTPALAGFRAIVAMQRLAGHPGVAVLQDTTTSTNVMLISSEHTPEGLGIADRKPHPLIGLAPESRAGGFRYRIQTKENMMANKQQQVESGDQLYFDGSAEPNPGGRMGAGWRLVYTDRPEETGSAEWPAARENTNNRAEYLALIGALEQYLASGRPGPLRVQGDSQLVINQMTGEWGINNPALLHLNRQATALVRRIPGGVRYRWIPREENQVADTLAGGQLALAGTPPVFAEQTGGDTVAVALAEQIARLNQAGKMSFKEALGLRVGGMDQYSRWHLQELVSAVGAAGVALIDVAFPGQDAEAIKTRETALRWMVRGLSAQLAIRKVQVDQEVQANRRQDRTT